MTDQRKPDFFGRDHANSYDARWEKLAPMRDGLHFLTRIVLGDLPTGSRILCVGAGTGAELLALARWFPRAEFLAVEPSAPMLDVCRDKVARVGVAARCRFHVGYLDSAPRDEKFDAATSILVSQFLTDERERVAYFREIAARLRPGGMLINADLAYPDGDAARESLTETWLRSTEYAGSAPDAARAGLAHWGRDVAVSRPDEIESMIAAGGFESPTLFHQALFIHAWYARSRTNSERA